jgi:hypothetical protein
MPLPGQKHERYVHTAFLEGVLDLMTVHAGHGQIQYHASGTVVPASRQERRAIGKGLHRETRVFQQGLQSFAYCLVIINDIDNGLHKQKDPSSNSLPYHLYRTSSTPL